MEKSKDRVIFQDTKDGRIVAYLIVGVKKHIISTKEANKLIAGGKAIHDPASGNYRRYR